MPGLPRILLLMGAHPIVCLPAYTRPMCYSRKSCFPRITHPPHYRRRMHVFSGAVAALIHSKRYSVVRGGQLFAFRGTALSLLESKL